MWRLILATVFSFFPRRWRMAMPGEDRIPWERGATISGILQSLLAIEALILWYSLSVTTWVSNGVDSALRGGAEVPEQAIGFAGLALWALHPLTWVIAYFAAEGMARMLGAAFTGHVMGTLPLYLADWIYGKLTHRPPEGDARYSPGMRAYADSFVTALKDEWHSRRLPQAEDEVTRLQRAGEAYLEIHSCRQKKEWTPPRIVRVEEAYYRLEETRRASPPRPYVYRLRKLEAGVPGRNVIVYEVPPGFMNQN